MLQYFYPICKLAMRRENQQGSFFQSKCSQIHCETQKNEKTAPEQQFQDFSVEVWSKSQLGDKQECSICLRSIPESSFHILECGHKFCQQCIQQHAKTKINNRQLISCPEQNCNHILNTESQVFLRLSVKQQARYQQFLKWREVIEAPNLRLCTQINCIDGIIDLEEKPVTCNECHKSYSEEQISHLTKDPVASLMGKQNRICPKCMIPVTKTEGYNQIKCTCGYEFCFVCLQEWKPKHYECVEKVQFGRLLRNPPNTCLGCLEIGLYVLLSPVFLVLAVVMSLLSLGMVVLLASMFLLLIVVTGFIKGLSSLWVQLMQRDYVRLFWHILGFPLIIIYCIAKSLYFLGSNSVHYYRSYSGVQPGNQMTLNDIWVQYRRFAFEQI